MQIRFGRLARRAPLLALQRSRANLSQFSRPRGRPPSRILFAIRSNRSKSIRSNYLPAPRRLILTNACSSPVPPSRASDSSRNRKSTSRARFVSRFPRFPRCITALFPLPSRNRMYTGGILCTILEIEARTEGRRRRRTKERRGRGEKELRKVRTVWYRSGIVVHRSN